LQKGNSEGWKEEASALYGLGMSVNDVARAVRKAAPTVSNFLRSIREAPQLEVSFFEIIKKGPIDLKFGSLVASMSRTRQKKEFWN
jgi:hypothetical protein